ncbi:MAG: hypothetical protein ACREAA_04105 [Candidatus Polarisedimenticolia bacterium]
MSSSRSGHGPVLLLSLISLLAFAPVAAQTSASYRLEEGSINNGGNPVDGVSLTSPHFQVRFDSIGEIVVDFSLASPSFLVDGGFVGSYPPPGEVQDLRLTDTTTFQWDPERSAAEYEVYRGPMSSLPGTFGVCFAGDVSGQTITDASTPPVGQAFFYLVTARNSLAEEGPKGYGSDGTAEGNPLPCP